MESEEDVQLIHVVLSGDDSATNTLFSLRAMLKTQKIKRISLLILL